MRGTLVHATTRDDTKRLQSNNRTSSVCGRTTRRMHELMYPFRTRAPSPYRHRGCIRCRLCAVGLKCEDVGAEPGRVAQQRGCCQEGERGGEGLVVRCEAVVIAWLGSRRVG